MARLQHPPCPGPQRPWLARATLALAVLGLHGVALYALHIRLLRRAEETVVPVEVLVQFIEPKPPTTEPPPMPPQPSSKAAVPQPKPKPVEQPLAQPVQRQPQSTLLPPPPLHPAVQTDAPAPDAVVGTTTSQPPAPPIDIPVATAPAGPPAPPATPAPPRIELPSTSAEYLNNRPPPYPPLSRRLGEQGKVVVRVLIDIDGTARQAEVKTSSGYDRLDQAALKTVLGWTYMPGKVNGEPKAMWFNVPIHFVLE